MEVEQRGAGTAGKRSSEQERGPPALLTAVHDENAVPEEPHMPHAYTFVLEEGRFPSARLGACSAGERVETPQEARCFRRGSTNSVSSAQENNPTGTRWVGVNKGEDEHPDVRMRHVAKEFHAGPIRTDTFAGPHPLLALRFFTRNAASTCRSRKLLLVLQADKPCEFYVELPLSV